MPDSELPRQDQPSDGAPAWTPTEAHRAIEAICMVADSPVEPHLLAELLEVPPARVTELCEELAEQYRQWDRGFVLVRVAGGYRFQSHPDLAGYLERFVLEGQSSHLSSAAMETLAIVAYKQPVSRAQIAAIRGVNADAALRTLVQRGYVSQVGRDPGPGQAVLFGTTPLLLERLGLDSIDGLPPLAQFVPGADVMEALEQGLRVEDRQAATGEVGPDAGVDSDASAEPDGDPDADADGAGGASADGAGGAAEG